jgi:hypothetical protein
MPIQPHEANAILPRVRCFFDELVARYDEVRYPPHIYDELVDRFQYPQNIGAGQIDLALRWKYARLHPRTPAPNHAQTIARISARWPVLLEVEGPEMRMNALVDPDQPASDFVSRAFLVHLTSPDEIPIIDRFNHRAVRWFIGTVRGDFPLGGLPSQYDDVVRVHDFVNALSAAWGEAPPDHQQFDRFLMMFGKNVAPKY